MSSYIPGSGLKKPLNQLDNPIYPDIKKGPPRFVWTKKHWTVDEGRTQMQVEHIPQIQEAAVLVQSRDYNKQHAYGNFPKYTTFVNKEFRPPLIERDDILPLSRVPRPVIVPRSNPGTAFSSGGSAFSQQNTSMPQTEKYLTDRVKEGEIRPTFFAPISMPEDNSVLPDLEMTLPSTSASAGYAFPTAMEGVSNNHMKNLELQYKSLPVASTAGHKMPTMDAYNAFEDAQLDYSRPQVSVIAGKNVVTKGMTLLDVDEMDYNRPQVAVIASRKDMTKGLTLLDAEELTYNRPNVSVGSGYSGYVQNTLNNGTTATDMLLDTKLEGTQGGVATATFAPLYDPEDRSMQQSATNLTDAKDINHYAYIVPSNTIYQSHNEDGNLFFREKQNAIGKQHGVHLMGHVRRSGVDKPQVRLRRRK